jgi:hypothetical protein
VIGQGHLVVVAQRCGDGDRRLTGQQLDQCRKWTLAPLCAPSALRLVAPAR